MQQNNKMDEGFASLMDNYILALEGNSEDIAKMLKLLQGKKLTQTDKQMLAKFQKDLDKVDKKLKKLGK